MLCAHPLITTKEHKEVSSLELSYIGGYMKSTFQNRSCTNGQSLPLIWQNFFSCYSVRAFEILPGLLKSQPQPQTLADQSGW